MSIFTNMFHSNVYRFISFSKLVNTRAVTEGKDN